MRLAVEVGAVTNAPKERAALLGGDDRQLPQAITNDGIHGKSKARAYLVVEDWGGARFSVQDSEGTDFPDFLVGGSDLAHDLGHFIVLAKDVEPFRDGEIVFHAGEWSAPGYEMGSTPPKKKPGSQRRPTTGQILLSFNNQGNSLPPLGSLV